MAYELPKLPSSFQNAAPAAPSTALATTDPAAALTTPTELQLTLQGPQYNASQHIPPDRLKQIQGWAHDLVRDPGFDAPYLANYSQSIRLDTSLLNDVLSNTRALDAGEVGDLTIKATHIMDQVNDKIPKNVVDARFLERVQNAQAKYDDIVSKVKYIARAIMDALKRYESLQSNIAEVRGKLQEKYDLMFQAIVLNKQLAENEDKQTDELVSRTAELECLLEAIPAYVAELRTQLNDPSTNHDQINATITRLNGFMPLVTKALSMLKPMIFTGNNAVQRYLNLSNMAGGRALVLGLFLSVGMYRWESDIVTQLQEMEQLAVGLAESNMETIMNQQAQMSSAAFVAAAKDYVNLFNRWTTTAETLQQIVDDTKQAQQILSNGFAQVQGEYKKTSSAVQDAITQVQNSQQQYNSEMERIAQS